MRACDRRAGGGAGRGVDSGGLGCKRRGAYRFVVVVVLCFLGRPDRMMPLSLPFLSVAKFAVFCLFDSPPPPVSANYARLCTFTRRVFLAPLGTFLPRAAIEKIFVDR